MFTPECKLSSMVEEDKCEMIYLIGCIDDDRVSDNVMVFEELDLLNSFKNKYLSNVTNGNSMRCTKMNENMNVIIK